MWFSWQAQVLSWQWVLSVSCYLDVTDSLQSFSRKCLPHAQMRKISLILWSSVLCKQQPALLTNQTAHVHFLKTSIASHYSKKVLCTHLPSHHTRHWKDMHWSQDLTRCPLNCFIMGIVQWNQCYFYCVYMMVKHNHSHFPTHTEELFLLHHCANVSTMKNVHNVLVFKKLLLW